MLFEKVLALILIDSTSNFHSEIAKRQYSFYTFFLNRNQFQKILTTQIYTKMESLLELFLDQH